MGGKNISEIKNKNVRTLMYQKLKKEKQKVSFKQNTHIFFYSNYKLINIFFFLNRQKRKQD